MAYRPTQRSEPSLYAYTCECLY